MLMMRLILRLKSSTSSFREWKVLDTGQKKEAGFVEVGRFFGTSNGYLLTRPIARKLGEEIVNALHLGHRNRASDLLSQPGIGERALKVQSFIPILQYCAGAPDPLFVLETWKLMTKKDVRLSGKCYFFTIKALCKGGYLYEAFSILSIQRAHSDIYPTLRVYNYLLKAFVQMNSLNHANEVLHLMEQEGMLKDTITYCQLIKSTAMEALQVMSLRMISERADILEEYRLKYENVILDEEREAVSEIMKVFKDSPFLVVALLNLRWCAILVSPPSWLPDQSPWAKGLSSDYVARLRG